MAKKLEQINHANVKTLFRDIRGILSSYGSIMEEEIDKLDEEYSNLESELMKDKRLVAIGNKISKLKRESSNKKGRLRTQLGKIERRFYADGPTVQVMNALRKMLDEIDGKQY